MDAFLLYVPFYSQSIYGRGEKKMHAEQTCDDRRLPVSDPALEKVITSTGNVYHLSESCNVGMRIQYYNKTVITAAEADKQGLFPCHVCKPPRAQFSTLTHSGVLELCNQLLAILDKINSGVAVDSNEGNIARIERLSSSEAVPQHIKACIKTIIAMRKAAESRKKELSSVECKGVDAVWDIVKQWAINSGIRLPEWTVPE
jgi:hypothetical protein